MVNCNSLFELSIPFFAYSFRFALSGLRFIVVTVSRSFGFGFVFVRFAGDGITIILDSASASGVLWAHIRYVTVHFMGSADSPPFEAPPAPIIYHHVSLG